MGFPRFTLGLTALALSAMTQAQSVKVDRYVLPNGLKVILNEDHSLPSAVINIWYNVGSKDEPPRHSGFAHLFEHLMFMGTARVPNGQFDKIMEAGGGSNNADTTEDRTDYYSVGPANLLPTLLWLDADRMEGLGKAIDQKKLDLQRDVVKNERRENTENTPNGKAYEAINGLMFPEGHPYHTSVIGSMDDLDNASVKDVKDFFATYYVPNNASLVISGDFDPKVIKPLIGKLFGTLPRQNDVIRKPVPPVGLHQVKRLTMLDKVQAEKTIMVWHSPAAYKPGDAAMKLTASILSDGLNSRLYRRLVVKQSLVSDISAGQDSKYLGSMFSIDATASPGVSLAKVEKAIDEVVADYVKNGPTVAELSRQGAKLEYGILAALQSTQAKASLLNSFEFYFGQPNSFKRILDEYRNATPASVRTTAAQVLNPQSRLILHVIPQGEAPALSPRENQPAIGAEKPFVMPVPTQFTLSNGVKVSYWRRPEIPLMSLGIQEMVGADTDPSSSAGLSSIMVDMLERGAGKLKSNEFSNAMDELGANFGATAGHLTTSASLSVTTANFNKALPLYADAVLRPRMDADEFTRLIRQTVSDLAQSYDEPKTVASLIANQEYFGAVNPYGRPTSGTPGTVRAISLEDVKLRYRQTFQPKNAGIFAAGSLPVADLKASLEKAFGGWKNTGEKMETPTYAEPKNKQLRVVVVDKPGAVQTTIRFIMPAPVYGDPNRTKLEEISTILGGSFTSRLNQNIRELHGYAYGAGAGYSLEPQLGYLAAASDVRADVTGASIKEFLAEFAKIRGGDITDVEVTKAGSTLRAGTVDSAASLNSLVSSAMDLAAVGKSLSELNDDMRAYSTIKSADLNAIVKNAIPLEGALLVLVGDKAQIMKQLEGLGLPKPDELPLPKGD